jgi:hypothetical protein
MENGKEDQQFRTGFSTYKEVLSAFKKVKFVCQWMSCVIIERGVWCVFGIYVPQLNGKRNDKSYSYG